MTPGWAQPGDHATVGAVRLWCVTSFVRIVEGFLIRALINVEKGKPLNPGNHIFRFNLKPGTGTSGGQT